MHVMRGAIVDYSPLGISVDRKVLICVVNLKTEKPVVRGVYASQSTSTWTGMHTERLAAVILEICRRTRG